MDDRRPSAPTHLTRRVLVAPSALLPIAMSIAAVAVIVTQFALGGLGRQADEGTAAHLWQLLMAGQLPIIAYFAVSQLPRRPREALVVLVAQVAALLAAAAPIFVLGL